MTYYAIILSFIHLALTIAGMKILQDVKMYLYERSQIPYGDAVAAAQVIFLVIYPLTLIVYGRAAGFW
jgi:hypothetical protein